MPLAVNQFQPSCARPSQRLSCGMRLCSSAVRRIQRPLVTAFLYVRSPFHQTPPPHELGSQYPSTYSAILTAMSRYLRFLVRSYAWTQVRPHHSESSIARLVKLPSSGSPDRYPAGNTPLSFSNVLSS